MTQDSENGSQEMTPANSSNSTSRIRIILSITLMILFIISSLFLMIRYSLKIYNGVVAANTTATVQNQTRVVEYATAASAEAAATATEDAVNRLVSHMTATAIAESNATAEAEASATPISYPPPTDTNLVINDPLTANNQGNKWDETSDQFGTCGFSNQTYQITVIHKGYFEYCLAKSDNFNNFIYEAQMKITQGDGGGLIIRADNNTGNKFYYFLVNQDGTYEFSVFDLSRNVNGTILSRGYSSSIGVGLNTPNIVALIVLNNVFQLYVNNHRIAVVGDNSFSHGFIGLFAKYESSPTTVLFRNVKVWQV